MSWRIEQRSPQDLVLPFRVGRALLASACSGLANGGQRERPLVEGDRVLRGAPLVAAAQRLGWRRIEVLSRNGAGPNVPMGRPLYLTAEQRAVIEAAIERVREMEPEWPMKEGRAVELALADWLSGVGWPT